MKYTGIVCSLLLISFFAPAQTWGELKDSIVYYYKNNEIEKSIIVAEKSIVFAKQNFGSTDPDYATSLHVLAGLYRETRRYEKAESLYIESIKIRKNVLGETDPIMHKALPAWQCYIKKLDSMKKQSPCTSSQKRSGNLC